MAGFRDRLAQAAAGRQAAGVQALRTEQEIIRLQRHRIRMAEELGRIENQNSREARRRAEELQGYIEREEAARGRLRQQQDASMTTMQRGFRDAGTAAVASASNALTRVADEATKQISRAHQALLQNFRGLGSQLSVADYGRAVAAYGSMIDDAADTALKYGMSIEDVTSAQHEFIQSLNIDVSAGNFSNRVAQMADTMAYLATRTGQTVAEINDFATNSMTMFSQGTAADMDAYERSLRNMAQLPGLLREEVAASMGKDVADLGAMFSNPQELRMIQQWTAEFGDQAANIHEMHMGLVKFSAAAAKSGHSIRTINNMRNAIVSGTQGTRGHSANTLLAGRILQQRIASDPGMLDRYAEGLRRAGRAEDIPADLSIIRSVASGNSGLNASDTYNMMKGTAEGMDAFMEGLVGLGSGDISISKSMLEQQGIDTGNDRDNLRLAHLIAEMGQGNVVNREDVTRLLDEANERETGESDARAHQYRNVAATAFAAEQAATVLKSILALLTERLTQGTRNRLTSFFGGGGRGATPAGPAAGTGSRLSGARGGRLTGVTPANAARRAPPVPRAAPAAPAAPTAATRMMGGARGLARRLPMIGAAIGAFQAGQAWLDPSVSVEDASSITGSAITDLAWPIAIANALGSLTGVGTTEDLFRGLQEGSFVQPDERSHIVMPYENEDGSMLDEDWRRMLYGRDNTFFGIDMSTPTEEPVTVPPQQQNQAAPANQGTSVPANGQSSALVPAGATLQANGDAVFRLELRAEHFNDLIRQTNFQNSRNAPVGNVVNSIV